MRRSGILLPVFSLPSRHGIGKMGKAAYEFVDFLKGAEVSCWQVLPLSPTGYGDSPYQSCCTYAGNPYLIDLDLLAEEGLLVPADYDGLNWGEDSSTIPYALLYTQCYEVLRIAFSNAKPDPDFDAFVEAQKDWLEDYALYMALKFAHDGKPFTEWGRSLRRRKKEAMDQARETYKEDIAFHKFIQYQFFRQWYQLKAYANEQGISIIGDLPIYTAADSVEVWAHPELFELNVLNRPAEVAGCPPDCFSATGQLWGNPVYHWEQHKKTGYAWWIHRLGYVSKLFDMVRIDHFRGFESDYSIPAKKETAEHGTWMPGPGLELFQAAQQKLGDLNILAEDLGNITPQVRKLLSETGYQGMKVLQCAFDSDADNEFLPHNYTTSHCVVYTGTHDNDTLLHWAETLNREPLRFARAYLDVESRQDVPAAVVRAAWSSIAELAIAQMQDFLKAGGEGRMNLPSTLGGNWCYRTKAEQYTEKLQRRIRRLNRTYGRK